MEFSSFIERFQHCRELSMEVRRLNPLFKTKSDYEDFKQRHDSEIVRRIDLSTYKGKSFLGIDAGSTTIKLLLFRIKVNYYIHIMAATKAIL